MTWIGLISSPGVATGSQSRPGSNNTTGQTGPGASQNAALKRKPGPELRTYHATMLVTRAEDWCVEAESPEEARELLAAGLGHRCHLGERVQFEVESVEDE